MIPEDITFSKKDVTSYLQRAANFKTRNIIKDDFFSNSPPSIFIGSKLPYPNVNVGILTPPEQTEESWFYDAETTWPSTPLSINDIINLRSSLINSRFKTNVYSQSSKFLNLAQEIGMASQAVDVEITLKKKVRLTLNTDRITKPSGPKAPLQKATLTENPKISTKVDKVVSDTDLKSSEAMNYLYKNNINENTLSQLLSIGVLGLQHRRRLVPTRWSITASDDIIGKHLINQIKDYPSINDHTLYIGNYFGNYYFVMLFPDVWSYELFELYVPGSAWNTTSSLKVSTDSETYQGRKTYASNTAGGYYASRLPIVQHLNNIKRQASVLVLRFETPEYHTGLGVWVVRSSAKKAMANNPLTFSSKEEILKTTELIVKQQLKTDITPLLRKSKLLTTLRHQAKLTSFF
jgi:DNA repair protein NreA